MAKFDPVLRDHVRRIDSGAEHITYLGKTIENELIACVGNKMLDTMVSEIKDFKYYAIILCFTPDVSHQELFWKCGKNLHTLLRIPSKVGHLEEACERHTQVNQVQSMEPLRYQARRARGALLEVRGKKTTDPVVKVETHSLA